MHQQTHHASVGTLALKRKENRTQTVDRSLESKKSFLRSILGLSAENRWFNLDLGAEHCETQNSTIVAFSQNIGGNLKCFLKINKM